MFFCNLKTKKTYRKDIIYIYYYYYYQNLYCVVTQKSNPDLLAVDDGNGSVSDICRQKLMLLVRPLNADRFDTSSERLRQW